MVSRERFLKLKSQVNGRSRPSSLFPLSLSLSSAHHPSTEEGVLRSLPSLHFFPHFTHFLLFHFFLSLPSSFLSPSPPRECSQMAAKEGIKWAKVESKWEGKRGTNEGKKSRRRQWKSEWRIPSAASLSLDSRTPSSGTSSLGLLYLASTNRYRSPITTPLNQLSPPYPTTLDPIDGTVPLWPFVSGGRGRKWLAGALQVHADPQQGRSTHEQRLHFISYIT